MANYVYGIIEDATEPPATRGILEAPVEVIQTTGAAALVSELPGADQVELGREELLVHARVLEQALEQGTVLPMRFGVVLDGAEAVRRDLLEAHADELHRQLQDLGGKVEIRVRATYEEEQQMREVVSENPEIARRRAALAGRSEDATYYDRIDLGELVSDALERKRAADAETIVNALGAQAAAVHVAEPAHERIALNASFLVDRKGVKQFEDEVEKVAAERHGRLRITFSDPMPPHSFVEFAGSG